MNRVLKISILIIMPALIAGMIIFSLKNSELEKLNFNQSKQTINISVTESLFYSSLNSPEENNSFDYHTKGSILPHHDLAGEMMADYFSNLKNSQEVKTFIIIGPNHQDVGLAPVITADVSWNTPMGELQNNSAVQSLVHESYVSNDYQNIVSEHSVQVLMPYISNYFPQADVIPLAINSKLTKQEAHDLGLRLASLIDDRTVLINSLDFSHYLPSDQTAMKDAETELLIRNKEFDQLWTLGNDHIDSPYSLLVFLYCMEELNSYEVEVLDHRNSAHFLGDRVEISTSYLTINFH